YFIQPTLLQVDDPGYRTMCEELFGPVLTTYVYPAAKWSETLALVDRTGPYALTGAVFLRDRAALVEADRVLRQAAGNYYVNDKPTGAVVGQQPFGGARASGTKDKAGSVRNLLRWVAPRSRGNGDRGVVQFARAVAREPGGKAGARHRRAAGGTLPRSAVARRSLHGRGAAFRPRRRGRGGGPRRSDGGPAAAAAAGR